MAAATATVVATRNKQIEADTSETRHAIYFGTLAISADPDFYTTDGLTVNFAGVNPHSSAPVEVEVWSEDAADGYTYRYITGTDNTDGKLLIEVNAGSSAGPLIQLDDNAAIPSAISGNVALRYKARYIKGR